MAINEQGLRLPPADSHPLREERFLPTCKAALYHCVVGIFDLGSSDFLGFLGCAGFDLDCVAFAVESDYFYREVFEFAVGVERAADVANVCHDFEVFGGF